MQENKISQDDTKYFTKEQLQGFLERRFGLGIDFRIRNVNYRWIFSAPTKVEKHEIKQWIEEMQSK